MNIKKFAAKILLTFTFGILLPTTPVSADIYTKNKIPEKIKNQIEKIVDTPSNLDGFSSFRRKTRQERIEDNIKWYKKHFKVNQEYTRYGLDIKNYRNQDDYMTGSELKLLSVHHGNVSPLKHRKLLADKLMFDEKTRKYYPENLADVYFAFKGENIIPRKNTLIKKYKKTFSALKSLDNGTYFVKELSGLCGNNAMIINKTDNDMTFRHVTKGKITKDEFKNITGKRIFFVQKYVENHEKIKKLSPVALSTVRIVTTRFNTNVHILSSDLRVGCSENSIVDNFAKEGAVVHVDEKTGRLDGYAFRKHKKIMDKHPISNIKFKNYKLPFWNESIDLVKKLHNIFPEFSSIGWDIAITQNGPVVIEGNCCWDYTIPQTTTGGLLKRWEQLKKI